MCVEFLPDCFARKTFSLEDASDGKNAITIIADVAYASHEIHASYKICDIIAQ
jgi:hypothetical protein